MKRLAFALLVLLPGCSSMPWDHGSPYADAAYARREISKKLLAEDHAGADRIAREAEPFSPDDVVLALLAAESHAKMNDDDAAIASLTRALAAAPTPQQRGLALRNRAKLLMDLGRASDAVADLEGAIESLGSGDDLERELGSAAYAAGDFEKARQAWLKLPADQRDEIDGVVGPGFFAGASVASAK